MINFFSSLILLISYNCLAHHHIESSTPSKGKGVMSALRVFKNKKKINYMAEFTQTNISNVNDYKNLEMGGKYRVLRNLKVGAYYSRHFKNTEDENIGILELSPRFLFDFLPGERWVAEFRVRYLENFFRHQSSLRFRPGLTYFWFRNGAPFFNFFGQYEVYRSLDYGARENYAHWLYLGALYHYSKSFQLSPFFSYAIEKTGWRYEIDHKFKIIGVNLIIKL